MKRAVAALLLLAAGPCATSRVHAQTAQVDARAPFRVGGPIRPPVKIKDVKPVYPPQAHEARVQGTIIVEVVIDETGHVAKTTILRSIPLLDQAALDAVRQWEFRPTLLNGVAIPIVFTTVVTFSLAPERESQRPPLPADALERAAALFTEARTAIQSGGFREASSSMPTPWGQQYVRGGLLIELARRELKAFADQAADDADTAFGMFLSLPGGGPNVDLQPPATPEKLARMGKMQGEPEAIRILLAAGRRDRALELARTADIDRSDLYDQIIRNLPAERALELADECRAGDGTYPFAAIADVARAAQRAPATALRAARKRVLARRQSARREITVAGDDVHPENVRHRVARHGPWRARTARPDLSTAPPAASVNGRSEADVLGPWILEVMSAVDQQRAAALAGDHPDWEAARKIPGRTPGNPVGRSPMVGIAMAPRLELSPAAPQPQGAPDFERDLQAARALPEGSARVMKLMQLASPEPAVAVLLPWSRSP